MREWSACHSDFFHRVRHRAEGLYTANLPNGTDEHLKDLITSVGAHGDCEEWQVTGEEFRYNMSAGPQKGVHDGRSTSDPDEAIGRTLLSVDTSHVRDGSIGRGTEGRN